jgi:hypothetical protein
MLRAAVISAGALLTCAGAVLLGAGIRPAGWEALGIGLIVLTGTLFERWRYSSVAASAEGRWQRTGERFIDPTSGEPIEVLFDPATGERRYVTDRSRGTDAPP